MIPITKTKLPDIQRYFSYIQRAWDNGIVTNGGELVQELEHKLAQYLDVKYISLVSNGTVALMLPLKAIGAERGKNIITTPYSYIATTAAIRWAGYDLKFADIEKENFNIDPAQIEKLIDVNTVGIVPVHAYGVPCSPDIINIAKDYNLKVIYDASHCFGVANEIPYKSFLSLGNYSAISLHATKVLGTGEGGLVISNSAKDKEKIDLLRSFGLKGDEVLSLDGLNAKMTELQAAFGLASLEIVHHNINKRKAIYKTYKKLLKDHFYIHDLESKGITCNYLYFPILVNDAQKTKQKMHDCGITVRRYFYPSLNNVYSDINKCPVSDDISTKVLCLPIYPELSLDDVQYISEMLIKNGK
jgi:dTDP-4-amino-4,6-dideoxygalactose transaminase